MALRLGGLPDLDLLSVPLPAGTEITTRVDREQDGVLRPQGAVGRVASTSEDLVEVSFLDGTRGRYLRHEVVPRKLGVVRYAQRRAASWQALAPCIVIDAQVGSRAWGLAERGSDDDRRGVFVLPFPWTTGLVEPPLDLVSLDGSLMYWEIGKAVRQALRADPNTLEMLFSAPAATDEMGEVLLGCRTAFLSREIYGSFGRYALSQLDRLEHNQRLADHRSLLLGWLAAEPTLSLDAAAERLAERAAIMAPTPEDAVRRGRDYLKQLYRSLYDQGLLASNEWAALATFAAAGGRAFEPPRDLRPKNAYNLIRLLDLAIRWLRGEPPTVQVPDALRPTLFAIKRGELPIPQVMDQARALTPALEAARESSPLPRLGDIARA
ncbi:MAG TPA: nucleotidyltransferase domain-containing protein, partial [Kofleriaceae bacterium]|nr:nucleotidyltransferase domain-containing protein [Kofleriaceae bacterium]